MEYGWIFIFLLTTLVSMENSCSGIQVIDCALFPCIIKSSCASSGDI